MNKKPDNEKVNSYDTNKTEEYIQSYWSKERQEKAEPIPLPSISPEENVSKQPKERVEASEIISEPNMPQKNTQ